MDQEPLSHDEWARLARLYDLERYLFEEVSPRFRREGTLSAADFYSIVVWKSNRTKTVIRDGMQTKGLTPDALMRKVAAAESEQARLDVLLAVPGIGLPIASAILTVCYPDRFTVLDYRAWASLQSEGLEDLPRRYPTTPEEYLRYRDACLVFAARVGLSLRDLDRALWARSWEKDLKDLIAEQPLPPPPPTPAAVPSPAPSVKIHVAVYLASRMLAAEKAQFSAADVVNRVRKEFADWRPGVALYAGSHCVANSPKGIATVYNYLWRVEHGRYRCFVPGQDLPHPTRFDAPAEPDREDVPELYRHLLT